MRVGLDIGGTKTDAVALDAAGAVAHSLRLPTGRGETEVIETVVAAVNELAQRSGIPVTDFESIGVGIPGTVDAEHGLVSHALNLGVAELALGPILSESFDAPVRIENDVNAAAIGAFHQFDLPPSSSLAYLNLGTGLAAGLVLQGRLWRGSRGTAGEIGHILVDPAGPLDLDGQRGGLEVVASGSGIARQLASRSDNPVREMLSAAEAGDPIAQDVRRRLFEGVAASVRILVLTVDVETVVIGGGISGLGATLQREVAAIISGWEEKSPFIASLQLTERMRMLPPDSSAAATGAAWLGGTPWQR